MTKIYAYVYVQMYIFRWTTWAVDIPTHKDTIYIGCNTNQVRRKFG